MVIVLKLNRILLYSFIKALLKGKGRHPLDGGGIRRDVF